MRSLPPNYSQKGGSFSPLLRSGAVKTQVRCRKKKEKMRVLGMDCGRLASVTRLTVVWVGDWSTFYQYVAQRTNASETATTAEHWVCVASSNLTTLHNKPFKRRVELPRVEPEKYSPWEPTYWTREFVTRRFVYTVWT